MKRAGYDAGSHLPVQKEMEPQRHGDHPGKVVKAMEGDTNSIHNGRVGRGVWRKLRLQV